MILDPLTIPLERYVIADITDGTARTDLLHLPAPGRTSEGGWLTFASRIQRGFPPPSWPSACGRVQQGAIYIHAGALAGKPICPACSLIVAPRKPRRPRLTANRLASERTLDGIWHVRLGNKTTAFCGLPLTVTPGRKRAPSCGACITAAARYQAAAPDYFRWAA